MRPTPLRSSNVSVFEIIIQLSNYIQLSWTFLLTLERTRGIG